MYKPFALIIWLSAVCLAGYSQQTTSADELFKSARDAAFNAKDYPKAKLLASRALALSPDYSDISVFLGRLYAWTGKADSARYYFNSVLSRNPSDEDASIAAIDLEYWDSHYDTALEICNRALKMDSLSAPLRLRKAKILKATGKYAQAATLTRSLLKDEPKDKDAKSLYLSIKDKLLKNKISLDYDYTWFNRQYSQAWHLASLAYARYTGAGTVILRLNYANRFGQGGYQGELDAYPHLSKTFYSYVNVGYSQNAGVFPKFRAGFSLYANLPRSFEAELGTRYLYFSSSTSIFTAYIGKYYRNFLFGLRSYLTPSSGSLSQSYSAMARYYTKGPDDYFSISAGSGMSPDDNVQNIQFNSKQYKLSSWKASVGVHHTLMHWYILSAEMGLINQEYLPGQRGNQWDASIGMARRF
ncbi:MAG: YaiO family outer membrane beta-barrel protein [Bacteroidota bacterium]|nr:YaiO family outer membrane beta-barrel protein [Bacteroidota bacterium]